jgi:ectoine hydroxylase-related dioxygenase (phytanoyl-CoA dioxygenase family)
MAILDQLLAPNFLLSAMQSINIFPGETTQPYHQDDGFVYNVSNPHPYSSIGTVWAMTDFTSTNGATELLQGSHRWAEPPTDEQLPQAIKAEMKAGSVIIFVATIWHGGGPNRSKHVREAVTFQYCQPWMRPQENILLGFDPKEIPNISPRMLSLIGMSVHPPFVGHYDGQHPAKSPWALRGKL